MLVRLHPNRSSIRSTTAALGLAALLAIGGTADAAPGTPADLYSLAQKYLLGEGVPRDAQKCFELAQKAAEQGHPEAWATLGYCYSVGFGAKQDDAEARRCFSLAAEKGSIIGKGNLGLFIIRGRGGEKDAPRGVALMQEAARAGNQQSAILLGEIFYIGEHANGVPDYQAAHAILLGPAEAGNATAQNTIGVLLKDGRIGEKDELGARIWLERSAMQGNAKAGFNIGEMLWKQQARDSWTRIEALRWLTVADRLNETMAYYFIEDIKAGLDPQELRTARELAQVTLSALPAAASKHR